MTDRLRIAQEKFDAEARRYGPTKAETLDQVERRIIRQATMAELVTAIAEWHPKAAQYKSATDWARQIATVLDSDFRIERR